MFNWLFQIYLNGYKKEKKIIQKLQKHKKMMIFLKWKEMIKRLRKENKKRNSDNASLIHVFRKLILCSKVFIAFKKVIFLKNKSKSKF